TKKLGYAVVWVLPPTSLSIRCFLPGAGWSISRRRCRRRASHGGAGSPVELPRQASGRAAMQCAGLLFQIPRHVHTWTTRTVDRHNFAGLPLNPYFVAGLIHGGGLMLLQYRLGFELRRSDVVI